MAQWIWLLSSVVALAMTAWFVAHVQRHARNLEDQSRRAAAEGVLRRHGMTAGLYMPAAQADNPELHAALDYFTNSGYLVTDYDGALVGAVFPRVVARPRLRLVASND